MAAATNTHGQGHDAQGDHEGRNARPISRFHGDKWDVAHDAWEAAWSQAISEVETTTDEMFPQSVADGWESAWEQWIDTYEPGGNATASGTRGATAASASTGASPTAPTAQSATASGTPSPTASGDTTAGQAAGSATSSV